MSSKLVMELMIIYLKSLFDSAQSDNSDKSVSESQIDFLTIKKSPTNGGTFRNKSMFQAYGNRL